MISARVFHSVNQNLPGLATTVPTFDSELWDDANFHSPANPTRLTIPVPGRYLVGASTHYLAGGATGLRIRLRINGALQIAGHTAWIAAGGWADVDLSLATLYQFAAGDYLELLIHNTHLNARTLEAVPNYSPHFWATYQGPLP